MYISVYIYISVCMHIYMYIHICRYVARAMREGADGADGPGARGQGAPDRDSVIDRVYAETRFRGTVREVILAILGGYLPN